MRNHLAFVALVPVALACSPAVAATVADPLGDFLPSYIGPHDADLDVLSFSAKFDSTASQFLLGGTLAGTINPANPGLYVIGVDTGAGANAPFADIGEPNVRFDQVVVVQKNGTGIVTGAAGGPLPGANITIDGSSFSARVPLAMLPSTGFSPARYAFNLWPRVALGANNQIADFAPENALLVGGVPEPSSWAMMLSGFMLAGTAFRSSRKLSLQA
ncbi:PEPxxWA-CTERM sorting domain-containing protein [Sphingomonas sp. ID1715]|uniref:PEPxxWA-CTERM sorting domain-containing protein n=1 Tax=Sphingomonas sp. ID1715 TaxID=1656898 RepID=UPI001489BB04|nr:PEPxxWA-CTERM sorting domain-containing protein [Sphingomonas sp. ID1715]NNM77800.1 PEPxxWA-CTERM sorting domain-containing protein [Sphingomonas sp. ID1715]